MALILINVLALCIAPIRFFYWNADHPGTVVMNVVWVLFNMVIIGSANAVAFESRQLRADVRIDQHIPTEVRRTRRANHLWPIQRYISRRRGAQAGSSLARYPWVP